MFVFTFWGINMKKCLSIALLISMILTLCSCKNNETTLTSNDPLDYNVDFQYYYSNGHGASLPITKSDTGYYVFLANKFLYYIDRSTMEVTPLCNKVNCLHNDKETCDAYFNTVEIPDIASGNSIQYNNGKLYVVTVNTDEYNNILGCSLYSVEPDGSARKKAAEFKDVITRWLIHRGYFYYITEDSSMNENGMVLTQKIEINRLPLDNLGKEPETIFDSKDYFDSIQTISQFSAFDDYIYFGATSVPQNLQSFSTDYRTITINTTTLKSNEIKNDDGIVNLCGFFNKKILYSVNNENKNKYYSCNLDGSNTEFIKSLDNGDSLFCDGKHLYCLNMIKNEKNHEDAPDSDVYGEKIYIYNSDLTEKSSFVLPFKNELNTPQDLPQDPDYFIYINPSTEASFEIGYIDKSEAEKLNGDKAEYKVIYKADIKTTQSKNKLAQVDAKEEIDTHDQNLKDMFKNTQDKLYNISSFCDTSVDDNITGGFSVKLSWTGDGGNYNADFQIYKFKSQESAKKFVKENPLSFINKQYVAFVSVDNIPIEIKNMLTSIINNDPIEPIESNDFSGEIYSFS